MRYIPYRTKVFFIIVLTILVSEFIRDSSEIFVPKFPQEFFIKWQSYFIQPDSISCGPTAAAMLLDHYGIHEEILDVKQRTGTVLISYYEKEIGVTFPYKITETLNSYGLKVRQKVGTLAELKNQISKNHPCIVLLRSHNCGWHYLIVVGYNQEYMILADPGDGYLKVMQQDTFNYCWNWEESIYEEYVPPYICYFLEFFDVYPNTMIFVEDYE
jgi:hypothetical protein